MKNTALLLIAVAALGCSKSPAPQEGSTAAADGDITIPQSLIGDPAPADPAEVLVEVNGKRLTRGEVMRQVDMRLGGPAPANMPAGRAAKFRQMAMSHALEQFVKRTLLLGEADRLNIVATPEEISQGISKLKQHTPRNKTASKGSAKASDNEEHLRREVTVGIRIDKLLAKVLPPSTRPSESEIDAFIESHRDQLTYPETGLLPRNQIAELMKRTSDADALDQLLFTLLENAEVRHSAAVRLPQYDTK